MIRIVIENFLLFLLPAVAYFGYTALRRDPGAGGSVFDDAPVLWLLIAGCAVVILMLMLFANNTGGRPGEGYTPPALKNGHIEPGRVEK